MKYPILLTICALFGLQTVHAQYLDDDIYYNPKKETSKKQSVVVQTESPYISDMSQMDIDTYNRRGEQYYVSAIDTIGYGVENGEDFVYTQQIQKYYNPTIVVENANLLGDVLSNAYGNVEIVINNDGLPIFSPYYGWNYYYPGYWSPLSWNLSFGGWGWNVGFYNPWYSWGWGWGPSWSWGPGWGWGWGPGWGPGPGYWNPGPPMAWRPNGNRPVGPNYGWANNTRPGGNFNSGAGQGPRPGLNGRPMAGAPSGSQNSGLTHPGARPNQNLSRPTQSAGVVNNNGRWQYNTSGTTGHRVQGTGAVQGNNPAGSSVNGAANSLTPITSVRNRQAPASVTTTTPSSGTTNHRSPASTTQRGSTSTTTHPATTTNSQRPSTGVSTQRTPSGTSTQRSTVNSSRSSSPSRMSTPSRAGSSGGARSAGGGARGGRR